MKKLFFSLLLVSCLAQGQEVPPLPPLPSDISGEAYMHAPVSQVQRVVRVTSASAFDLQGVSVAEVVQLIYANAIKTPYMLAPDVLADNRPLSFRWSSGYGSLEIFLLQFLDSLGYKVERRGRVDFVMKAGEGERLESVYIYRPRFRSVSYLSELVSPMLKGNFSVNRQVGAEHPVGEGAQGKATSTNALGVIKRDSDTLIYRGTSEEIESLKSLLSQLDIAGGEVMVRALVYEVGVNQKEGSAFSLITSLFDGNLKVGVNTGVSQASDYLSFKNLTIDFVANILSSDSRFKVVSSPSLRIRSGEEGRFNVGQDVPILGSISYPREGAPVQSVEYRSSGVIFNVRPQVYEQKINLDLDQQISNFVRTETGVDSSPTLTKREISTSVSLLDDEIIVLGGLAETKDGQGRTGFSFLPDFLRARTSDSQRSELVVVLQVSRI